jgi:hypothetical protein
MPSPPRPPSPHPNFSVFLNSAFNLEKLEAKMPDSGVFFQNKKFDEFLPEHRENFIFFGLFT